jgi:hypothetical protein
MHTATAPFFSIVIPTYTVRTLVSAKPLLATNFAASIQQYEVLIV